MYILFYFFTCMSYLYPGSIVASTTVLTVGHGSNPSQDFQERHSQYIEEEKW